MFYYLEGRVAHVEPHVAVIDCGGVGYLCRVTLRTQSRLTVGERARLYTHLHVREEIFELYGFADAEEKSCFHLLTGVSGVGMKVALSLLSALAPEQLMLAVLNNDEKALCTAPGVGKKLAQRIILELRDSLRREYGGAGAGLLPAAGDGESADRAGEARLALQALGYSAAEAAAALRGLAVETLSLEELIRAALKNIARPV